MKRRMLAPSVIVILRTEATKKPLSRAAADPRTTMKPTTDSTLTSATYEELIRETIVRLGGRPGS